MSRGRPCKREHPAYVAGCPTCKLARTRPEYRRLWGEEPVRVVPLPCVHRGDRLPGQPCGSPLYACRLRGSCSVYTPCPGAAAECRTCPDRSPARA